MSDRTDYIGYLEGRSEVKECIQKVCSLTNYPKEVVESVLKAILLVQFDKVVDTTMDADTLPESIDYDLPGVGKITVERLVGGRNDPDTMWSFTPNKRFKDQLMNCYLNGESPLLELTTRNFEDILKFKTDNLIRGLGDIDE